MANVAHSTLTGAELHEPKGVATAALGTVYVANGAGSGSWNSVATSAFTGMIADFANPVAPTGWLELDGSVISTTTYSGLFAAMSITSSGTRSSGNATVTGIPSTAGFKAGYYVFGTGISAGTTILTVDSAVQITLSGPAGSSGTSAFFVSPWAMNTGTVTLPDLTTAGRFRRSRTSSTNVGQTQADQNKAHTHGVSGTSAINSADHTHTYSGNTGTESATHTHGFTAGVGTSTSPGGGFSVASAPSGGTTGTESATHTHTYSGTSAGQSTTHTHAISLTSASDGGTETRPVGIVLMTCIKT
jgi:hypothetical protein